MVFWGRLMVIENKEDYIIKDEDESLSFSYVVSRI